jgi:RNA polymerase sigma factor (sigma-70 family)
MIDLSRRHKALKRAGSGGRVRLSLDDSLLATLKDLGRHRRTPSRSAAAREFFEAVDTALGKLPDDYAKVIRLRHIDGWSQKDVADKMGRTEGAIEALCARALAALRVEMRSVSLFV